MSRRPGPPAYYRYRRCLWNSQVYFPTFLRICDEAEGGGLKREPLLARVIFACNVSICPALLRDCRGGSDREAAANPGRVFQCGGDTQRSDIARWTRGGD